MAKKEYQRHGEFVTKKEAERLHLNPGVTPPGYKKRDGVDEDDGGCGSPYCTDCYEPIETAIGFIDRIAPEHCRTSCDEARPEINATGCSRCDLLLVRKLTFQFGK
mgnify:CR=1 FL=1